MIPKSQNLRISNSNFKFLHPKGTYIVPFSYSYKGIPPPCFSHHSPAFDAPFLVALAVAILPLTKLPAVLTLPGILAAVPAAELIILGEDTVKPFVIAPAYSTDLPTKNAKKPRDIVFVSKSGNEGLSISRLLKEFSINPDTSDTMNTQTIIFTAPESKIPQALSAMPFVHFVILHGKSKMEK